MNSHRWYDRFPCVKTHHEKTSFSILVKKLLSETYRHLRSHYFFSALGDSIASLIGCDTAFIYGINRYGSYVKYNRQTKQFVNFKKSLTPSSSITAKNVSLQKIYDAMTGEQILDDLDMNGK